MDLPVFAYHPDPIASGSIVASPAECVCCGEARGFIYTGPAYCEAELEEALCPWCIADGSAHQKFDASFADAALFPDGIARETIEAIAFRTPGFNGWQQERWLGCC
ncbi:MAG: CbrC family protein, partial [Alphaproteobacteria bacterium]|nr:CbrC family protein [Alphaproteobacteria bacterium]